MISDKVYYKVVNGAPNANKSVIRNYIDEKDQKSNFELLVDFDKEVKDMMGLPTGGNIKEAKRREQNPLATKSAVPVDIKKQPYQNAMSIVMAASYQLNGLLRNNALTIHRINNLTLSEFQRMCVKEFGKGIELPTQDMLNKFKSNAKDLSITSTTMMKYAARASAVPLVQFGTMTEMEMWLKIADGRPVPEQLGSYINNSFKNFNKSVSDVPFANALRLALFVASYGVIAAGEFIRNRNVDLPNRKLNIKKDISPMVGSFNNKLKELIVEGKEEKRESVYTKPARQKEVVRDIQKERERTAERLAQIPERKKADMVEISFSSSKDLLQELMVSGINKDAVIDYDNLKIYRKPLEEFENIDKPNETTNDTISRMQEIFNER